MDNLKSTCKKRLKQIVDSYIYFESCILQKSYNKNKKSSIKKVLIIRKDKIGDSLLFYPTLSAYRSAYKDCHITVMFQKSFSSFSPLLKMFNETIWFDDAKYKTFSYRRAFLLHLARQRYDIVIYPAFSREEAGDIMVKITHATEKIACDGDPSHMTPHTMEKNNAIYTTLIRIPNTIIHELDKNCAIAERILAKQCPVTFPTIHIDALPEQSKNDAEAILNSHKLEHKKYVVLFPGAGGAYRMWPIEKMSKIATYFARRSINIVICGSKDEWVLGEQICQQSVVPDSSINVINICGKTNLPVLAHIFNQSLMYIGNDTGAAHLAVAIALPNVVILGGGHFGRFFPYSKGSQNHIAYDKTMTCKNDNWACAGNLETRIVPAPCIEHILVDTVIEEIEKILPII